MIVNNKVNNDLYISNIKEVKNDQELALVLKCATLWEKAAAGKVKYFKNDTPKAKIAKDAKDVAKGIQVLLKSHISVGGDPEYCAKTIKKGENAVFAAYDNRGKLQGVALVSLKNGIYKNTLDEILVNPERLESIGKRAAIKGTGTKLMQAVAQKVLSKKEKDPELGLLSLKSAIPFYEKLGFEDICPGPSNGPETEEMLLNFQGLKKLSAKP